MPRPSISDQLRATPLPSTVEKYWEAWYFLLGMCRQYHDPLAFRYEMNAFIQALRNVTFMLQSEPSRPEGFDSWYADEQASLREDDALRRFVNARNLIVKQSSLAASSKAQLGLFRGRRFKLGLDIEVSPFLDSQFLLKKAQHFMLGFMLDHEHAAIGEQVGLRRTWVVNDIGFGEITELCGAALKKIGFLLQRAHGLWGTSFDSSFEMPDPDVVLILLESDLDPWVPHKWGWVGTDAGDA